MPTLRATVASGRTEAPRLGPGARLNRVETTVAVPPRRRSWWDDWWFAGCAIALLFVSDFKWRIRDPSSALSASIDLAIVIELITYAAVGSYVVVRHGRPPEVRGVPLPLFLCTFLVALMVLSVTYATFFEYAVVRAGQMTVLLVLVLVGAADGDRHHFHRFFHAYMALVVAAVLYGVAFPSPPVNEFQAGRFSWMAVHPTVAGVYTGAATVLAASYAIWSPRDRPGPRWPRPLYVAALAIAVGGLLAVHTRGAVLGAAVGVGVAVMSLFRGRARARALGVMVMVVLTIALAFSDRIVAYFVRGEDTARLATFSNRTELWSVAKDALEIQPMFGYGVGSSRGIFYTDLDLGGGHNAAVNIAVELGLVGFACWCALVVAILIRAAKLKGRHVPESVACDRAVLLAAMSYFLVDGFFYEGLGAASNGAVTALFVSAGWVAILRPRRRREPAPMQSRAFS